MGSQSRLLRVVLFLLLHASISMAFTLPGISGGEASRREAQADRIFYVREGQAGGGGSWADATGDLQDAIEAAAVWAEDNRTQAEVWVAAGTYRPNSWPNGGTSLRDRHFSLRERVSVYGGFPRDAVDGRLDCDDLADRDPDTNPVLLSGDIGVEDDPSDNCYHVFYHPPASGTLGALLDGVTVSAGNANGQGERSCGGGMYNRESVLQLSNCLFTGNYAAYAGGGVFNSTGAWWGQSLGYDCLVDVVECVFAGNTAGEEGGGMFNGEWWETDYYYGQGKCWVYVSECVFTGNMAGGGGGIANGGGCSAALAGCTFAGNTAEDSGGGILSNEYLNWEDHSVAYPSLDLWDCAFRGNTARSGGGMANSSQGDVERCVFIANIAEHEGGGVANWDCPRARFLACAFVGNSSGDSGGAVANYSPSAEMLNCVFSLNSSRYGGGVFSDSSAYLVNCTFCGNSAYDLGGALCVENASPPVSNCIFWGNGDEIAGGDPGGFAFNLIGQDEIGGYPASNINGNPLFADASNAAGEDGLLGTQDDGLRLLPGSPALGSGDELSVWGYDFAGSPRLQGVGLDMGAYEQRPLDSGRVAVGFRVEGNGTVEAGGGPGTMGAT